MNIDTCEHCERERHEHGRLFCKECMDRKFAMYCPVGGRENGKKGMWLGFFASLAVAVTCNIVFPSALMPVLYIVPVILLASLVNHIVPLLMFGAATAGLSVYLTEGGIESAIPVAGISAAIVLLRRVIQISRRSNRQKLENEQLFMSTILAFSKSIDARDPYTAFHSKNVANYARKIAQEMGLGEAETEAVYLAGMIHDIGKIGTPEHILHKESRLTDEEYEVMKTHAEEGYRIIKDIERLQNMGVTEMVRHHHERYDGKGYPMGLKGADIPLGARILAASDAYDAMTTNRSYRQKLSAETAADELERHSGTQFDPEVARAFLAVLRREERIPAAASAVVLQTPLRQPS
ncbi:HD-GYP domain-containing protein [Paenibacillus hamazuiensis]|uniref:HD-GYP domain-containing protein n=1 Tax=Paenibacillus hamazuiensis TaxID=2936508 RepID=UPI00200F7951|nr:HD-GYP domain-containing protein [Paenibacillus hamazuiensis]